jgi:hypothetical protein
MVDQAFKSRPLADEMILKEKNTGGVIKLNFAVPRLDLCPQKILSSRGS